MSQYHMNIEGACLVAGCRLPATRILNVRMRRPDTGASFGPNIDGAVFCEYHADQGADIEITFTPTKTGEVRFIVHSEGGEVTYWHPMRNGNPGQEALL